MGEERPPHIDEERLLHMDKTKILAFYLPQFHTIPENDEWWGKGFTEWVNVKKAAPLYRGHNQPRVPLDRNYYDLADGRILEQQMRIAMEYGVYGFCYYHYWFNGKLLLEKPLERMLQMEQKIKYCLCWANEPWTRSWENRENEVLMPQSYGSEPEWEAHFQYLLRFFKDPFYIKEDGRPMLLLYRTTYIPGCEEMIAYWNQRCIDEGFGGIYTVEEKNNFQKSSSCRNSDAVLEFEPMYTLKFGRSVPRRLLDKLSARIHNKLNGNQLLVYDYDRIWKAILGRKHSEKVLPGAFVDWDNTPRKGTKGLVIRKACPHKFSYYMQKQVDRANKTGAGYIFVNAWNEWGEGTYLEPDTVNGMGYLEAIKNLKGTVTV